MAFTGSFLATQFKVDVLNGVHQPGDAYKIALYTNAATLDASTTAYTATGEVSGTGYSAPGLAMSGFTVGSSGTTAWVDFTTDPAWSASSITARGALIYNSTRSNKAIAVIDFGVDKTSSAGTFTVTLPTADATNALIRLA
jgi:hypothetical protein